MHRSWEDVRRDTYQLWHDTFHETKEFMDVYFSLKYNDETNLTIYSNHTLAAAVQLLPCHIVCQGHVLPSGYISGLATATAFRGQGFASRLLDEAHRRLFSQNAALAFLIPASEELRAFYAQRHHGAYHTVSYRRESSFLLPQNYKTVPTITIHRLDKPSHDVYRWYSEQIKNSPQIVCASERDFEAAILAGNLPGGTVLLATRCHRPVGFCISARESDARCFVRTLMAADNEVEAALLNYLSVEYNVREVWMRRASLPVDSAPYVMARVAHVERFLDIISKAYPTTALHFGVQDDLSNPQNNGFYILEGGHWQRTQHVANVIWTPGELAAHFISQHPLQAEMLLDE